jgi:hypothetical protein
MMSPRPAISAAGNASQNLVFVSYSHADTTWLQRLRIHLKPLERQGAITLWDDTRIKPGTRWREEIRKALEHARVAVLLVTADFLASDFITMDELPPLLRAAEKRGTLILPVIVKPCRFEQTEGLCDFQAVNSPSKPLVALHSARREELFSRLSGVIEEALRAPSGVAKRTAATLVEQKASQTRGDSPATRVEFGPYAIRALESGSIEVEQDGHQLTPTKPVLREIASKLQIELLNRNGNPLNTRQLGRLIIDRIADLGTSLRSDKNPAETRDDRRLRFWKQLLDSARSKGLPHHANRSPTTAHWIGGAVGITGYSWNYVVWTKATAVELMIDTNDKDKNKKAFDALHRNRSKIEASFGAPLEWERLDNNRRSEIRYTVTDGGLTAPEEQWATIQSALVHAMASLTSALQPHLGEV